MRKIKIGEKVITKHSPCYIIAEGATNHNNRIDLGIELVRKAKEGGADAIKIQTYKAGKLVTKTAPRFWELHSKDQRATGTQYENYSKIDKFPKEGYDAMMKEAKKLGIHFFSSPFDFESVDFLENLGVIAYKVASADITNIPLLKYIAEKGKPMFISTGMSRIGEIEEAVEAVEAVGNKNIILMHCVIKYPTPYENVNLRAMQTMMDVFSDIPVGLSDHTIGIEIPLASVALGAKCIEKHFTLDKTMTVGADHWFAVDPGELKMMTSGVHHIEAGLGSSVKKASHVEDRGLKYARRSLVTGRDMKAGHILQKEDVEIKRPGTGIKPKYFDSVIGRKVKKDIKEDAVLQWDDLC